MVGGIWFQPMFLDQLGKTLWLCILRLGFWVGSILVLNLKKLKIPPMTQVQWVAAEQWLIFSSQFFLQLTWRRWNNLRTESFFERDTVIGSDLFGQDDYIKRYLEDPDLPFITVIKIGLRYYVTGDLILQLDELKNHLNILSFKDFSKWYTRATEWSLWWTYLLRELMAHCDPS